MTLTTHHLSFTAEAVTAVELDDQAGSAIRGAIVGGLWERFCANKAARVCAECPLVQVCPVAALVAPMRAEGETGGEQKPRPYVTRPPAGRQFAPGEPLSFGLALFGQAALLFPYVVMAAQEIERHGLGRPLRANAGRRGTLRLTAIAAVDPLTGARQPLYTAGHRQVHTPGLPVEPAAVAAYAATLPGDQLTLQLLTPLRLIDNGRLVRPFALRPFVQRLVWRLNELGSAYAAGPLALDYPALVAAAEQVQVLADQTRWVDVVSYSRRTGSRTPIGGLVGSVTLAGDLSPLRELLVWGTLVHVGKNAVKGDGWYAIT